MDMSHVMVHYNLIFCIHLTIPCLGIAARLPARPSRDPPGTAPAPERWRLRHGWWSMGEASGGTTGPRDR